MSSSLKPPHGIGEFEYVLALSTADLRAHVLACGNAVASVVVDGTEALRTRPGLGATLENFAKFAKFTFAFGNQSDFRGGLDERIGAPSEQVEEEMEREHTAYAYSTQVFKTSNYGVETTPLQEWAFVVDAAAAPKEEPGLCEHPRQPKPLQHFIELGRSCFGDKLPCPFTRGEIVAIRLYTGAWCTSQCVP